MKHMLAVLLVRWGLTWEPVVPIKAVAAICHRLHRHDAEISIQDTKTREL